MPKVPVRSAGWLRLVGCMLAGMFASGLAVASVTMVGTRVIYPGDAREVTVQFNNRDAHANLVQVWLDTGNDKSTIETADAPFAVTPQIFRMNAHTGQMVRIVFTGSDLPSDRETMFFLNFSQIPATRASSQGSNKLVLMFGSRLKLFYRPKGLSGSPAELPGKMTFARGEADGKPTLHVDNPTPWYAVVREAVLLDGTQQTVLARAAVIAPKSAVDWPLPAAGAARSGARLRLVLVNDHGSDTVTERALP